MLKNMTVAALSAVVVVSLISFGSVDLSAQELISPGTQKVEERMAVINAGRAVRNDDLTVARFRFLLSALRSSSGESDAEIADKLSVARRLIREKFGKDVGLLDLTETAYQSRSALAKGNFAQYVANLVVLIGSK